MRSRKLQILLLSAALAFAPSCASKPVVKIQPTFPPTADLKREGEPALPPTAFETQPLRDPATGEVHQMPTAAAIEAEGAWNDDILAWGRRGWAQVGRLCQWSKDMGAKIPFSCLTPTPVRPSE